MNQDREQPNGAYEPRRRTRLSTGARAPQIDPRPASPGQLALIGVGLWLAGILVPALGVLTIIGILALVVAGVSLLIRPRSREMYWRGRRIELGDSPTMGERIYRMIYRR